MNEFPSQRASNVERVSMSWRHHISTFFCIDRSHSQASPSRSFSFWAMAALHPEYNSCEDECPVCLLKLQEARYLHCNHLFCLRCLDQIHTVPSTALRCPMCRQVTFLPDDGPRCLPGIKSDLNRERAASPSFDPKQGVNDAPDHSEPHPSTSNYDGVETMRLFLQDVYGKKNPIIINADAAVSDLKEKVQAITGLPVNDMRLISGGQELAHGKSLRSCNLPEDSVLQTSTKNAEGSVKILVENEHGEKISVFVPIDGRVSDVQAKVMEQLGIHPREQRLMFGDRELSDHQSLRSVGAIGTSVLRMEKVSRPTGFTLPRNRRPALPDIR